MIPNHDIKPHPTQLPRSAGSVALWLILASLSMLFLSGMLGYFVMRHRYAAPKIALPHILIVSTALVLAVSVTLQRALAAVRAQNLPSFRFFLRLSIVLAVTFLLIQTPALSSVLQAHYAQRTAHIPLYGIIFFLILLHAAHVMAGIFYLLYCLINTRLFDHEHWLPIRHATIYWHFLDLVWMVMFGSMLLTA